MLHSTLVWLEKNVRLPLKDTIFDVYIALPLKALYKRWRKIE